tara:strand:- start:3277 stop:3390 length:114 start_codon:yes stop_codon:yes gene_type:complete
MDALIVILFVAVVAAIVIKRKKPELWSTIMDKVKVWK